jgi:glycosyltransferase involved in cell wall biosynthesis
MKSLSMVIPALNEEVKIALTVRDILPAARKWLDKFEIIVVNDGSTDKTPAVMDQLAAENPEVSVIHHAQRQGVGVSYRDGIAKARMEHVTLLAGDHNYDTTSWEPLFNAVGAADIVLGYRENQGSTRAYYRFILSRLFHHLIKFSLGVRIKDIHGTVVYPTAVAREIGLQSKGYLYQVEMLAPLYWQGCTIVEVPVYMLPEDTKHSRSLAFRTFKDIVSTIIRLRALRANRSAAAKGTACDCGRERPSA